MNDGLLSSDRIKRLLDTCWSLEDVGDMRDVVSILKI